MGLVVNLESLRGLLSPHGWTLKSRVLTSPSGVFWLTPDHLSAGAGEIYRQVARRREAAVANHTAAAVPEYQQLLKAFEQSADSIASMADAVRRAAGVFHDELSQRGFTIKLWSFSNASVRAVARHPAGGIGYVEWLYSEPDLQDLCVGWWLDDYESALRTCWGRPIIQQEEINPSGLAKLLHLAVDKLRAAQHSDLGKPTPIAALDQGAVASEDDYWSGFEVLR